MIRFTTTAALIAVLTIAGTAQALPGPAPGGTAIGEYDWLTGQIVISVNDTISWFVFSASGGLTGDPTNFPGSGSSSDSNGQISQLDDRFNKINFEDWDLGYVAATGLPLGDLTMNWHRDIGVPPGSGPVVYVNIPEPLLGDFDEDGDVDGFDFLKWQQGESPIPFSASDLADWEMNYGTPSTLAAAAAIPEPSTLLLVALATVGLLMRRR